MKSTIITIIIIAWIGVAIWAFTNFIGKSMHQENEPSTVSADLMGEQREKARQTREDQKRMMEDLQRKVRDQHRR